MSEAISYIFMWHSLSDACPRCQNLNGREWYDQDIFQNVLWDPIWGNIWDLDANHSMAHGNHQYNCRCQLEVRVQFHYEELKEVVELQEVLGMMI